MKTISALRTFSSVRIFAFGLTLAAAPFVSARSKGDLDIELSSHRIEKNLVGDEVKVKTGAALPGDVLEYTAVYANRGNKTLGSLAPTLPIPEGMEYVSGSVRPAPAFATLDGKKFEAYPIRRMRELPNGRTVSTEVSAKEYRGFRWNAGDLSSGTNYTVSSRVRVVDTVAPAQR